MKTYDRAQVLQVAAQLLAGQEAWTPGLIRDCISTARELIDEVERQCPRPGKPEPTVDPPIAWHRR